MRTDDPFMKKDYFFKWLSHTINECAVCGVPAILVAAVFNSPAKPAWGPDGKLRLDGDSMWICERCCEDLSINT